MADLKLSKKNLVILDLDDTLVPCQIRYDLQKHELLSLLFDQFGQHLLLYGSPDEVLRRFDQHDSRNVEKMGFTMQRFPTSMKELYGKIRKEIQKKSGIKFSNLSQEAYKIGQDVFLERSFSKLLPFPDSTLVLDYLKDNDLPRKILTKGDSIVQGRAVSEFGLEQWFEKEDIHVVDKKNPEVFRDIIGKRKPSLCYMVGNSIRSDINPALEAGLNAIHIPFRTWCYEDEVKDPTSEVLTLNSIGDMIALYGKTTLKEYETKKAIGRITEAEKNQLVKLAYQAQKNAYNPYSHYSVGAALLAQKGARRDRFFGANVENKLYTPTKHAEELAVCNAVIAGYKNLIAIANVSTSDYGKPPLPCGICQEFLSEFNSSGDIIVIAESSITGQRGETLLKNLLHNPFKQDLTKK